MIATYFTTYPIVHHKVLRVSKSFKLINVNLFFTLVRGINY